MKKNEQPDKDNTPEPKAPEAPEFLPQFFWAFVSLLLYKVGGIECVTQKQLEKFNPDHCPDVMYDHEKKAWIMKLKDVDKPVIVTVPKKMMRKTPKILLS